MNRARAPKKDYQKIIKGLGSSDLFLHPENHDTHNNPRPTHHNPSPEHTLEDNPICYTTGVYNEHKLSSHLHSSTRNSHKKFTKQSLLYGNQQSPYYGPPTQVFTENGQLSLKNKKTNSRYFKDNCTPSNNSHNTSKRIKTLQRSIEYLDSSHDRIKKDSHTFALPSHHSRDLSLRKAYIESNVNASGKNSPYVKKLRQSLNASREKSKTQTHQNILSNHQKRTILPSAIGNTNQQPYAGFKLVSKSEMKFRNRERKGSLKTPLTGSSINGTLDEDDEQLLFLRGKNAYQNDRYNQAIQAFSVLLAKNPNHLEANYLMAVCCLGKNEYSKGAKYFEKVLELDKNYNKNSYILSAIAYKKLQKTHIAIQKLSECLKLFPTYSEAYVYRAKLYLKDHKYPGAIKDFQKAVELSPEKPHGYLGLAECQQGLRQFGLACQYYTSAFDIDGTQKDTSAYLKYLDCLSHTGRNEQALNKINQYLTGHSVPGLEGPFLKAVITARLKKYTQANMQFQQILKYGDSKYSTKAIEQMIKVKICERDFYSAHHLLERIEFMDVEKHTLERIRLFTEAVLNLMKRKYPESLDFFEQLSKKYEEFRKQVPEDEIHSFLRPLFRLYRAYGHFCISSYQLALEDYSQYHTILNDRNLSDRILESSEYNKKLCEALIAYTQKKFQQCISRLDTAERIYPHKVQPYLYEGIAYIRLAEMSSISSQHFMMKALELFSKGIEVMGEVCNNTIANVHYHRAVCFASMGVWNQAINDVDRAIEKSEDNIPKYFYLRALIFACCQSFKQAIHDVSVCISINQNMSEAFLLRSKCLQIEGQSNQAFVDLQRYITLKPQDPLIHKYAGHLLFENGAFEDSILAYAHGEIKEDRDIDIFVTRAKAYFLLGDFVKAHQDLGEVFKHTQSEQVRLDYDVLQILCDMQKQQYTKCIEKLDQLIDDPKVEGKIFRLKELKMLKGGCLLYTQAYHEAISQFKACMALRLSAKTQNTNSSVDDQEMSQDQEEAEQIEAYLNHMRFNMSLCYIFLNDMPKALDMCVKCTIEKQRTTLQLLMSAIKFQMGTPMQTDEKQALQQIEELQIFSLKNKLSKHLSCLSPKFNINSKLVIRPCFSFPKVEPPEIVPQFDKNLLRSLQPDQIQNKPEAPWIRREQNCIMFTSNIQIFDNLDLMTEEKTKRANNHEASKLEQSMQINEGESECESDSVPNYIKIRQKLKLEGQVEAKLNKLFKK